MSNFSEWLMPHLTSTMPGVANKVPYLAIFDALMILGTFAAASYFVCFPLRIRPEDKHRLATSGLITSFRSLQGYLNRTRFVLISFAVVVLGTWVALSLRRPLEPEWNEIFLVIIYGMLFMPTYLVVTMLRRAFGAAAERLEQALSEHRENPTGLDS